MAVQTDSKEQKRGIQQDNYENNPDNRTDHAFRIKIDGSTSIERRITAGVVQESALSSILYNTYSSKISKVTTHSKTYICK